MPVHRHVLPMLYVSMIAPLNKPPSPTGLGSFAGLSMWGIVTYSGRRTGLTVRIASQPVPGHYIVSAIGSKSEPCLWPKSPFTS